MTRPLREKEIERRLLVDSREGDGLIVCCQCFDAEMQRRKQENRRGYPVWRHDILQWENLKIYKEEPQ